MTGVGLAVTAFAVLVAVGGSASTTVGQQATSPFGGSSAVLIGHVGSIEVDLETGGAGVLHRVQCLGAVDPATSCFIAR